MSAPVVTTDPAPGVSRKAAIPGSRPALPPLQSGDRLTRREFERRYEAMPTVKQAELIEGVVFMSSPLFEASHGQPQAHALAWLGVYKAATPGLRIADNTSLRLDNDNEYQPDAILRIDERLGGRSRIAADQYLEGAPELIFEVAASSASVDLYDKFRVYRRVGVQEYIVWQVYDQRINWWELVDGEYAPLAADEQGIVRSSVFPGLWLNVSAMLNDDLKAVLETLQQGIASAEHAAFVTRLAAI